MRQIPFSPPDITQKEVDLVVETLKSGWITTGPKTKLFEKKISEYCGTSKTVCLNSATAALQLTLRMLGVGPGDEVITSAYTYTASASVIHHVGAKIILIDVQKDSTEMDYEKVKSAINENTKVIIPIDIAGVMCDYEKINEIVESKKNIFKPRNEIQLSYNRVVILADAAHSFGASYKGKRSGNLADFTCFSFHAVKNLTTAEGGAVTWKRNDIISCDEIYKEYQLLSLHGQNKDAFSKNQVGAWEYDIIYPAYKCNMTDLAAAFGLGQLERYDSLVSKRHEIIEMYNKGLKQFNIMYLDHKDSSGHLYMLRLNSYSLKARNSLIENLAKKGVSCNVHYKPLPLMTAYKSMGFSIKDYPNAFDYYKNELTLPLHTKLSHEDVEYVVDTLKILIARRNRIVQKDI